MVQEGKEWAGWARPLLRGWSKPAPLPLPRETKVLRSTDGVRIHGPIWSPELQPGCLDLPGGSTPNWVEQVNPGPICRDGQPENARSVPLFGHSRPIWN